jgi:uncharacterized protein (DUF58 family)
MHPMSHSKEKELLKKVRRLEIKARRMSEQQLIGDYKSAFKGSGLSFAEVRPYQYGDEVRNIDWKVTARAGQPYVKMFEEERESSVLIILDNSASMFYGSQNSSKRELAVEIAAVLAYSAISSNDRVGLLLFDTEDKVFIPPKKGRNHLLNILSQLVRNEEVKGGETKLGSVFRYLMETQSTFNNCFLISDFQSADFSTEIKPVALKFDLVGLWIEDPSEVDFPLKGWIEMRDMESGKSTVFYNESSSGAVKQRRDFQLNHWRTCKRLFRSAGADLLKLQVGKAYIPPILKFFKSRK